VANLPFSVNDDALKTLFSDYKVSKAHVIITPTGRSKGFGFVVLEGGEEEQQRALAGLNKYSLEGRELTIKVAFTEQRDKDRDTEREYTDKVEAPVSSSTSNPNSNPSEADPNKSQQSPKLDTK